MKWLRKLRMLIILAGACTACAHSPAVTAFGHCTSDAIRKAGNSLLGRVMTALATGDYVAELAKLAAQLGADEVGCGVDLAIAQLKGMHAYSPDPVVRVMLERAQAWRGANP